MNTIEEIAAKIDPAKAQRAVAEMVTVLGANEEWNSDVWDRLVGAVQSATADVELPIWADQDDDALAFWTAVTW